MSKQNPPADIIDHYSGEFDRLYGESNGKLTAQRQSALAEFQSLGLPTAKQEDWRNLDLAPLSAAYEVALPSAELDYFDDLDFKYLPRTPRLVFVNGHFTAELSNLSLLPEGVTVNSQTYLLNTNPDQVNLEQPTGGSDNPFELLNRALFNSGASVEIAPDQPEPVNLQLIFITKPGAEQQTYQIRNLVRIGANSRLNLIEQYIGITDHIYFNNVVTDVHVAENGSFNCIKIQGEAPQGVQLSTTTIDQQANSTSRSLAVSLDGRLIRNNLKLNLLGEGGHGELNGLYLGRGEHLVDNHTLIDHAVPNCTSDEMYKGILDDKARAIFNGKIVVRPYAQKTDANQINRNLLLSNQARVHTNPQLEIYADDVKCSHGSTTGELNPDALFYLQSRGISATAAQALMINGFANEVLDTISDEASHELLSNLVDDWFNAREENN